MSKSAPGERDITNDEERVVYCPCRARYQEIKDFKEELNERVKIKEDNLREEFENKLQNHLQYLKDRFNNILRHEQVRTSNMLREANRDKQEKINALQTQLECANMSALMFVVCCERRRRHIEIAALRDEYASYVESLEQLLADSQALIANLVRGYKTAARVDDEWRGKARALLGEFIAFIEHFPGGGGMEAQYCFDMPQLLQTETPVLEEPCDVCIDTETAKTEPTPEVEQREKQWWERLDDHPFLVFGDMSELLPGERLSVLREVRNAAKRPAPERWREYAFNNLSLKDTCSNWETIKQKYRRLSPPHVREERLADSIKLSSDMTRRLTSQNVDYRSRMGSIVKMITSTATNAEVPKTSLLAAKDSLEIMSVTKLRSRVRSSNYENEVKLRIGNKIDDLFEERLEDNYNLEKELWQPEEIMKEGQERIENYDEEDDDALISTTLGSVAADSMLVIPTHVPDVDRKISIEKICPEVDCQRNRDAFLESLPPYMRASPTTHFEMTYEQYETCTPEQLKILEKRIEELKKKERARALAMSNPLDEWASDDDGVAGDGHTSGGGYKSDDMPCACAHADDVEEKEDLSVKKLYPIKQEMDRITKEFFFDDRIQFDRFKVMQQDGGSRFNQKQKPQLDQVKEVLKEFPSLCGLFEGTPPC